jgi:hypothetical protein
MAALVASGAWTDPYKPNVLPQTNTGGFDAAGLPMGGGFHGREQSTEDTQRLSLPWVEFYLPTASVATPYDDTEADFHEVTVGMRARLGGRNVLQTGLHQYALSLCNAALQATMRNIRATALALEPVTAYGICYALPGTAPVVDNSSPKPAESNGTVSVDAVATFRVMQRQYRPDAIVP